MSVDWIDGQATSRHYHWSLALFHTSNSADAPLLASQDLYLSLLLRRSTLCCCITSTFVSFAAIAFFPASPPCFILVIVEFRLHTTTSNFSLYSLERHWLSPPILTSTCQAALR